jgi:hypothetical protein
MDNGDRQMSDNTDSVRINQLLDTAFKLTMEYAETLVKNGAKESDAWRTAYSSHIGRLESAFFSAGRMNPEAAINSAEILVSSIRRSLDKAKYGEK